MPTNTPDQQITIPIGGDAANVPLSFTDMIADVEPRLVLKYANAADRTARHTTPVAGDLTFLTVPGHYDTYDGAAYISTFSKGLFTNAFRVTDAAAIVSSTVLVTDVVLTSNMDANARYQFEVGLFYDSSTTADFKVLLSWSAAVTARWGFCGLSTTAVATVGDGQFAVSTTASAATALGGAGVGTANTVMAVIKGSVLTGVGAPTMSVSYAQNTSDPTNTIVRSDSYLQVWRV